MDKFVLHHHLPIVNFYPNVIIQIRISELWCYIGIKLFMPHDITRVRAWFGKAKFCDLWMTSYFFIPVDPRSDHSQVSSLTWLHLKFTIIFIDSHFNTLENFWYATISPHVSMLPYFKKITPLKMLLNMRLLSSIDLAIIII